jgi:cytochrome c biogenesis protein CcdA/thiol-disulfide isomerase/thioredoxin
MQIDLLNIGLAFLEGFALIISPCILPILPIILSGSLTGNKSRPLGIVAGFIIMFTVVTLFSRALIQLTHVSEDTIRNVSFGILLLLGITMLSTYLTEKFNLFTQRLTRIGSSLQAANNPQSGFWGGLIFGGLVGVIWTPCAGPILAAVIVQVIIQHTNYNSILVVVAFAIGAGTPMFLIAMIGRGIINKFAFIRDRTVLFRQLLGLIIIITVLYLMFAPGAGVSLTQSTPQTQIQSKPAMLVNGIEHPYPAPAIAGIDAWINSSPLTWNDLRGKVVLVDFWTYSCINCIRTLPYLKSWYAKYHDMGFEIIGMHSPEFQFEHDLNNVKNAVKQDGITYPVALDNQFVTWQNFRNEYWPAHYLINRNGDVVYVHFGEGEYDVTENNIRYLLGVSGQVASNRPEEAYMAIQTPETYLGYHRAERFSSPETVSKDVSTAYSYPDKLGSSQWALNGKWMIAAEKITSAAPGAAIKLNFTAGKVYMVMGAPAHAVTVKVFLNGVPITTDSGSDVANGQIEVSQQRLYSVVNLKKGDEGILEVKASGPGLEVYTFTFGD